MVNPPAVPSMQTVCRNLHLLLALGFLGQSSSAMAQEAQGEAFFLDKVYPALHEAQCVRCHSSNGVANETALAFPREAATAPEITAFGLSLADFVDRQDPTQSQLVLKPTRRIQHTGGERIKPGSNQERLVQQWATYLAGLTDEQLQDAQIRAAAEIRQAPRPLAIRRLTHSQYDNTVRDLLGDTYQPASSFPKEDFVSGFKNQVESQGFSPLQAEAYAQAAERLARAAFRGGDQRGLLPGVPQSPSDEACAAEFVRQFGRKAFRRPLTNDEQRTFVALLLAEAAQSQDFYRGAGLVVETMLQSPHFLFRIDRGGANAQYELASRLSYLLWDTQPDADLLAAAEKGQLQTLEQVEATARRMLADQRAVLAWDEFLAQWLRFDQLLAATRDRRRFREYNAELAAAMLEETRRLFRHLVWQDRDFRELFTANYTFINSDLARLYDLPRPTEEFGQVEYPADSGRAGVLGHGTFLVLTSKPAETSPTGRGLYVRNHFLGQEVPPPPPGVDTNLPAITDGAPLTNRQRLEIHLNSESCAGCHRLIDPIGLALEQYNAIGAFQPRMSLQFGGRGNESRGNRPTMVELDLDTSGYIQGIEGSEFKTPKELGRILAESQACQRSIVKQLFRYSFGREEGPSDQAMLEDLLAKFRASGYRFRELIVAMVTSDLFFQPHVIAPAHAKRP